jgi:hypothetical protein
METSELLRLRLLSQQQALIAAISSLRAVTGTTAAGAATCSTEPHAPPEKAGDNHDGPAPVIPEVVPVEMRGITLAQLRKVYAQIEHRCVRDHWTDKETQCPLEPHKVNLYHLNKYFIMKETEKSQLSYVEHITGGKPQKPLWFVSHWWGEPVADFIACIEQHAADRGLGADIPYWVCAYANNQHRLDPMTDPHNSPFRKALDLCEGTVTVLDQEAKCYTRVWCVYEIFTTLSEKKDVFERGGGTT